MSKLILTLSAAGALALAGCSSTGNVERNAVGGAALGAAVGAGVGAISGDVGVGEGAAIGGAVGAAGGAYKGYRDDQYQGNASYKLDKATRYYDERTGRYYYREIGTNRTFYENGERRS